MVCEGLHHYLAACAESGLAVEVLEKRDFFVRRAREIARRNFAISQSYVAGRSYVKWWNTKSAA
ncbi:MAG: hypothetical protein ACPL3C_12710, partial [Pyrobaculum sp.]